MRAILIRISAVPGSGDFGNSAARSSVPNELIYPERCNRLSYEGEIAIVLDKRGVDLRSSQLKEGAAQHIRGFAGIVLGAVIAALAQHVQ